MNDNHNHIGPNWSGRSPRTMREAFPRGGSIGGEWGAELQQYERRARRDDVLTVGLLTLAFLAGCVLGPFVLADPSVLLGCW